jgi:hypothetical protein
MSQLKNQLNGRCDLPFVQISSSDSSSRSDVILVAVIVEKNYYVLSDQHPASCKKLVGTIFCGCGGDVHHSNVSNSGASLIVARGGHAGATSLSRCKKNSDRIVGKGNVAMVVKTVAVPIARALPRRLIRKKAI